MRSVPDKPIVFFDGNCLLCNRAANFILKFDKKDKLYLATLQGDTADFLLTERHLPDSAVLYEDGNTYIESDAVIRIAQELGGIFTLAGIFKILPRRFRDYLYNFVARNRTKWFGRSESCRLPRPEERHKFLD